MAKANSKAGSKATLPVVPSRVNADLDACETLFRSIRALAVDIDELAGGAAQAEEIFARAEAIIAMAEKGQRALYAGDADTPQSEVSHG